MVQVSNSAPSIKKPCPRSCRILSGFTSCLLSCGTPLDKCLTLGKSTLAHILLRIFDFDAGELLINDVPIQHYEPFELHSHMSAVFQAFSKHNGTARENIGVGYVEEMDSPSAIKKATGLAKAAHIVDSMPDGLETKLDASGFYSSPSFTPNTFSGFTGERPSYSYHGLSGGEVRNPLLY